MKRLWLIFAQTVTISLAVYFVISTLKPEWLDRAPRSGSVVQVLQSAGGDAPQSAASYSDAARKV